jgi:hypothetical protein
MSAEAFRHAIEELPSKLRDDLNGYVKSVEDAVPQILRDNDVPEAEWQRMYKLVPFVAGVRRLYGVVNGQYWLMQDALDFAERGNFKGFRYGSFSISADSEEYLRAKELNNALFKWLSDNRIAEVVSAPRLSDAIDILRNE